MDVLAHGGEGVIGAVVLLAPLVAVVAVLLASRRRRPGQEHPEKADGEPSAQSPRDGTG